MLQVRSGFQRQRLGHRFSIFHSMERQIILSISGEFRVEREAEQAPGAVAANIRSKIEKEGFVLRVLFQQPNAADLVLQNEERIDQTRHLATPDRV